MRRNPPTPEGEPENAPNPLDDVPSSQSAERLKVSADQNLGVPLPDLTVRNCNVSLPESETEPQIISLPPGEVQRQGSRSGLGTLQFEVWNQGPGDAEAFDVHVSYASATYNETTNLFEMGPARIRRIQIPHLRAGHRTPLFLVLPAPPHVDWRLYLVVVDVNPMTANHPFGRVIEFDYTNNRCGCTFVDHPGWKMPVDPMELPSEEELEVWGGGPPWLTTQRR